MSFASFALDAPSLKQSTIANLLSIGSVFLLVDFLAELLKLATVDIELIAT